MKIDNFTSKSSLRMADVFTTPNSIQSANDIEFCTAAVGLVLKTEPLRFEPVTSIPRTTIGGGTSSQDA